MRTSLPGVLLLLGVLSCAAGMPGRGGQLAPGIASRDDHILLPSLTAISGVAAGRRYVFITSPGGIGMYDRGFRQWLPPLTTLDGVTLERVDALAAEPSGESVWIAVPGMVLTYDPTFDMLSRAIVPGNVDVIAFDARNPGGGAYVRTTAGWWHVSTTGAARPLAAGELPPREALIVPPSYEELVREYPALSTFERLLTRDSELRSWPVSAAARAPDRSEVWLGTWGNGLYEIDPLFVRGEHRPFGLLGGSVGALAAAAEGIWMAGGSNGRAVLSAGPAFRVPERGGLTFASLDLQQWRWISPTTDRVLAAARVHALVVRVEEAWIATDRGLFVLDLSDRAPGGSMWSISGLPSDRVLSLAAQSDGIWAGTAGGLSFVPGRAGAGPPNAAEGPVIAEGAAVHDLLFVGDTLWMATSSGLLLLPPGSERASRLPGSEPRLSRPIRALARSDSMVLVALEHELLHVGVPGGAVARMLTVDGSVVGGVAVLAMDERTAWIGGPRGLFVLSRASGVSRLLRVPRELPGEVRDVVLMDGLTWVATSAGVVRLRRLEDGTVP